MTMKFKAPEWKQIDKTRWYATMAFEISLSVEVTENGCKWAMRSNTVEYASGSNPFMKYAKNEAYKTFCLHVVHELASITNNELSKVSIEED